MKKKEVLSNCEVACSDMKENAKIVEVDFDDATEKKFLGELKITEIGDTPQTFVINSQGQIAGSFIGVTDSKKLVATATKKSACCAPGSGKSCGPTK
jgi:O-acetyl-ADP-ribose deacetylase (regulator of RNase III)